MKDRILFTIALLCIMLLASCSGGGSGDGGDNPTDRTLTYYMDISMEATAGSQIIVLNDLSTNVSSATSTAADGNKVIIKVVQKGTSQASDQPQTNDEVSDQQPF